MILNYVFGKIQHMRRTSLLLLHESFVIKSFTHKLFIYANNFDYIGILTYLEDI